MSSGTLSRYSSKPALEIVEEICYTTFLNIIATKFLYYG